MILQSIILMKVMKFQKKYEMKVKELEAKHKIHQVDNTNPLKE